VPSAAAGTFGRLGIAIAIGEVERLGAVAVGGRGGYVASEEGDQLMPGNADRTTQAEAPQPATREETSDRVLRAAEDPGDAGNVEDRGEVSVVGHQLLINRSRMSE
jgi:hypothetical protein